MTGMFHRDSFGRVKSLHLQGEVAKLGGDGERTGKFPTVIHVGKGKVIDTCIGKMAIALQGSNRI